MEDTWQQFILKDFPDGAPLAKVTILEDPDCLLAEEGIFSELARRGYRLFVFTRTIELRYLYETHIRQDDEAKLVILLRNGENVEEVIPPDIRSTLQCRRISLSMPMLFPHLHYGVLTGLERQHIQNLFSLRKESEGANGGQDATCEFIFENLLGISITSVINPEMLLDRLYHVHVLYSLKSPCLLTYFQEHIRNKAKFQSLRKNGILSNATHFHQWIGYTWKTGFLKKKWMETLPVDSDFAACIIFENAKVKRTMRALFQDDWLTMTGSISEIEKQYAYLADGRNLGGDILDLPLQSLSEQIPSMSDNWSYWTRFAREWAALTSMKDEYHLAVAGFEDVRCKINTRFWEWMQQNYSGLASIPSSLPATVQQIIHSIAKMRREEHIRKIALIVVDGMAWNQWIPIRQTIEQDFSISVSGTFAQVPTLTSVSRQSIFSGKAPVDFAESIETTAKESVLWKRAWQEEGIDSSLVKYEKGLGLGKPEEIKNQYYTNAEVLGLVVDTVDQFVHGTLGSNMELHSRIQEWLKHGYLKQLLHDLVDELGFTVFLTSDHGNVECVGIQNINDGILADMKGERVRIYPNEELRKKYLDKCPQATAWGNTSIPENFCPMILHDNGAFAPVNKKLVSHGGVSIEEVIVPFIKIGRKGVS